MLDAEPARLNSFPAGPCRLRRLAQQLSRLFPLAPASARGHQCQVQHPTQEGLAKEILGFFVPRTKLVRLTSTLEIRDGGIEAGENNLLRT